MFLSNSKKVIKTIVITKSKKNNCIVFNKYCLISVNLTIMIRLKVIIATQILYLTPKYNLL